MSILIVLGTVQVIVRFRSQVYFLIFLFCELGLLPFSCKRFRKRILLEFPVYSRN